MWSPVSLNSTFPVKPFIEFCFFMNLRRMNERKKEICSLVENTNTFLDSMPTKKKCCRSCRNRHTKKKVIAMRMKYISNKIPVISLLLICQLGIFIWTLSLILDLPVFCESAFNHFNQFWHLNFHIGGSIRARWKFLGIAHNWLETRDKRPLGRAPDRSWCHRHTSVKLSWSQPMDPGIERQHTLCCRRCPWNHWLRPKKHHTSVEVAPAPVRVPTQRPLAPSFMSVVG